MKSVATAVRRPRRRVVALLGLLLLGLLVFAAAAWRPGSGWSPALPGFRAAESVNLLFMGTDGGRLDGNTDTIVLAHVDPRQRGIAALWIPRDTLVAIPGHGTAKINAANPMGGPELAVATVEELLGVKVDYYLVTDFQVAAATIDRLGGVDVDVPVDMNYDDPYQNLHIHLRKGRQHLNGRQAVEFARFRHTALGDIARTQFQQRLVEALLHRVLSPEGLVRLPGAVQVALEGSRTNAGLKEVAGLLAAARGGGWSLVSETLPGSFLDLRGVSYWAVDRQQARAVWADLLRGVTHPTVEEGVRPPGGTPGGTRAGGKEAGRAGPAPAPQAEGSGTAVAEADGLVLTVSLPKTEFAPGERVPVTVAVENRGKRPVSYLVQAVGYPAPSVWVDAGGLGGRVELWERPQDRERVFAQALETRTLPAGQRVARQVFWDQRVDLGGQWAQVPGGVYRLEASLTLVGPGAGGGAGRRLQASLQFQIAGDAADAVRVGRDEAVALARRVPEVRDWYAARAGEGGPAAGARYRDGRWLVSLAYKPGPPPRELRVTVDARTGAVLGVERCEASCGGPEAAPGGAADGR